MERREVLQSIFNIAAKGRQVLADRVSSIVAAQPPQPNPTARRRRLAKPKLRFPRAKSLKAPLEQLGITPEISSRLCDAHRRRVVAISDLVKKELKDLWIGTRNNTRYTEQEAIERYTLAATAIHRQYAEGIAASHDVAILAVRAHFGIPENPSVNGKFDERYVCLLEWAFEYDRYPSQDEKRRMARNSGLAYRQISVWFQNRRARIKKKEQAYTAAIERGETPPTPPPVRRFRLPPPAGFFRKVARVVEDGNEEAPLLDETGETSYAQRIIDEETQVIGYDPWESAECTDRSPTTSYDHTSTSYIPLDEVTVVYPGEAADSPDISGLCDEYAGIKVGPHWYDVEDENGEVYRARGSDTDSDSDWMSDSGNDQSPEEVSDPDVLHPFSIHTFAYRDACLAGDDPDFNRDVDVVDYQQPNDDAPEEDNMSGSGSSGLESSQFDYRTSDDDVPAADEEVVADPEPSAPDEEEQSKKPAGFWSTSGFYFTEDHPGVEDVEREDINEMAHRPDMEEILMEPRGVFERRRSRKKKPKVPLPLPDCFNIPFIPAIAEIALQETIEQWGLNTRNDIPKEPEYDHLQGLRQYWTPEYTQDIPSTTASDPIAAVAEYYNRSGLEDHFLVLEEADVNYLENGWPRPNYSVGPIILDAVDNTDVPAWNIVETDYYSVVPLDANPALFWNPSAARADVESDLQGEYGKMAMYLNPEPELWPTEIIPSWKYEEPPIINTEEDFMAYLNTTPTVIEVPPPVDPLLEDPRPLPSIVLATAQPEKSSTELSGQPTGFEFDKSSADFFAMFTGHEFSGSVSTEPVHQPQEKANRPLPQLSLPSDEDADDTEVSAPGFIDWLVGLVSGLPKSSPQQSCAQPILPSDEVPLVAPVDPIAQLISDPITLPSFDFTPIVAPDVNDDFFSSFNNPILPTLW